MKSTKNKNLSGPQMDHKSSKKEIIRFMPSEEERR